MSEHPSTIQSEPYDPSEKEWDDHAALHRREDGVESNMLRGLNIIRDGTFAEMIAFVMSLPEKDRAGLVIQKSGDRTFTLGEIEALSRREDFPKG